MKLLKFPFKASAKMFTILGSVWLSDTNITYKQFGEILEKNYGI